MHPGHCADYQSGTCLPTLSYRGCPLVKHPKCSITLILLCIITFPFFVYLSPPRASSSLFFPFPVCHLIWARLIGDLGPYFHISINPYIHSLPTVHPLSLPLQARQNLHDSVDLAWPTGIVPHRYSLPSTCLWVTTTYYYRYVDHLQLTTATLLHDSTLVSSSSQLFP